MCRYPVPILLERYYLECLIYYIQNEFKEIIIMYFENNNLNFIIFFQDNFFFNIIVVHEKTLSRYLFLCDIFEYGSRGRIC